MKKITISDLPIYLSQHRGAWGSGHALHNPALWSTYLRFMRSSVLDAPALQSARTRALMAPVWLSSDTGVPIASLSLWTDLPSVFGSDRQLLSDYPVFGELNQVVHDRSHYKEATDRLLTVLRFPDVGPAPRMRLDNGCVDEWSGVPLEAYATRFSDCDPDHGGLRDESTMIRFKARHALKKARMAHDPHLSLVNIGTFNPLQFDHLIKIGMDWVVHRWQDKPEDEVPEWAVNWRAVFQASLWAWMGNAKDNPGSLRVFVAFDTTGKPVAMVGFMLVNGWWHYNAFAQDPTHIRGRIGPWILDKVLRLLALSPAGATGVIWTCPTVVTRHDHYEQYKRYLATTRVTVYDHLVIPAPLDPEYQFVPPYMTLSDGPVYA